MTEKYESKICDHCQQTLDYTLGLDKGSAKIVVELFKAIAQKGVNEIHPTKELNFSGDKQWFATNLSRPRFHGLIAYVERKKGYYCLTRKAGKFLRGEPLPQFAIISKSEGHQIGYWKPELHKVTITQLFGQTGIPFWEGANKDMVNHLDPRDPQATLFDFESMGKKGVMDGH